MSEIVVGTVLTVMMPDPTITVLAADLETMVPAIALPFAVSTNSALAVEDCTSKIY